MGRTLGSKNRVSAEEKFHRYYVVDEETGCWNWQKSRGSHGYGYFRQDGHKLAHRWAYDRFVAPIQPGLFVLHRCDNPGCVNPQHLVAGTAADNSRDMSLKGRVYNKGKTYEGVFGAERAARLKEALRQNIRAKPVPAEAAKRAGLSRQGRKVSPETRARIGLGLKAAHARSPDKLANWTEEQRCAQSVRMTAVWQTRKGL
jgi:hypothetical protein